MARRSATTRLRQIGLVVIVAGITLAFVLVFGQPLGGLGRDRIAEVNGESVGRDAFEFFREQIERAQRPLLPPGVDESNFQSQLDVLALDAVVRRYVMAQEARALGLRVSETEIAEEICSQPFLQRDGRCDPDLFARFVVSSGFDSERSYTEELRRDLLIRKLTRLVASPIRIADAHVEEKLRRDGLELRLRYATARSDDFRERIRVDPEQARALAEAEPERVAAAYEQRIDEFQRPERIRARHILFTGEGAQERAEEARARIEAGEDFVVLATRLSEDEATRELGGDLGSFPRGRMLAEFEAAAFAAEPRTLVGPVETERGVHLIRVEERQPALDRGLEEASQELAADLLLEDRARDAARAAAERMSAQIRAGGSFDEAALEAGLELDETASFRPSDPLVPGIGRVPGLAQAAAALGPERPDSPQIFGSSDTYYLIALLERREPDPATLGAEVEPARERMLLEARNRVLGEWYRARRESLERSGKLTRQPLYAGN